MSLELKPVQVRLPEEAYAGLKMLADANNHDLGEEAREILCDAILGRGHAIKLLAERLARAVGNGRER